MVKPIGSLMWEHRLIEKIVPIIEKEVTEIEKTSENDPVLIDLIVDFLRVYADKTHHGKEEDILFKKLGEKKIKLEHTKIIDELILEHITARSKVNKLSEANNKWLEGDRESLKIVRQMLLELADLYPEHIRKEDRQFFHQSMTYFSPEEQEKMNQEFSDFDKKMIHWKYQQVIDKLGGEYVKIQPVESKKDRYFCTVCGYVYDPEKGDPEHDINPGTSFKQLPDDWVCPVCFAKKDMFELFKED